MDAQYELVSETGQVKHAALTLYSYYCMRRRKGTGLCFPKLSTTAADTGITPKSNVSMLRTFLKSVAWIEVYPSGVIRPLKGFYSDEERFHIWLKNFLCERISVLIFRICVLHNRTLVLIFRTLFKGSINQLIEPAQLTSFSANSAKPESATAPDAQKFDKIQPAGKPTTAAPAFNGKPAPQPSAGKPADHRSQHAAVKMVKEITGRFPPKDLWDKIIREIRDKPDAEFFRASWEIWRSFGGKPTNFEKWLFEPNRRKVFPEVFNSNGNGHHAPAESPPTETAPERIEPPDDELFEPEPLTDATRTSSLVILRGMLTSGATIENLQSFADNYAPSDWQNLMEELQR